jgi:hypothetical protein
MTMDIEILKSKINYSNTFFKIFFSISILWICFCFSLLFPVIRDQIILFGERLIHRPLTHPIWHEKIFSAGIGGIILYFIFFFIFFFNDFFSQKVPQKIYFFSLIAVSAFFVFIIMYRANWTFSDDHEYITSTAINKMILIWTSGGRFFPLGHIHYDLPLIIYRCLGLNTGLPVEAHFIMIAVFFAVSVLCLYILFNKIKPFPNSGHPLLCLFFACSFFLLGTFYTVFLSLVFPETQGIMLFSIFILMYYKALETDKIKYYVIAFIVASYNTYCKEPVFGAFLVIALTNLLFRYKNTSKREKIFYFSLIANGLIFLILYYFLSYKNSFGFYNEGRETAGRFQLLFSVFITNPVLFIMFLVGFIRLFFVLIRKDREHLYYDSLLFAGISYTFAYIILRLDSSYYFLPSVILFLPSLVYWIKYVYSKKYILTLCIFFSLLPIYTYNYSLASVYTIKTLRERQIFIPYISDLLLEYNEGNEFIWYESDNKVNDNTFYMDMRIWRKHTLNAFLNYQNKSEVKEFFTIIKLQDQIDMNRNILFFYPTDNDQSQPMQGELVNMLHNNNFELYKDNFGVLIYRRH